jgi:hypothetical protein
MGGEMWAATLFQSVRMLGTISVSSCARRSFSLKG